MGQSMKNTKYTIEATNETDFKLNLSFTSDKSTTMSLFNKGRAGIKRLKGIDTGNFKDLKTKFSIPDNMKRAYIPAIENLIAKNINEINEETKKDGFNIVFWHIENVFYTPLDDFKFFIEILIEGKYTLNRA
jgi:hypothetical protein